MLGLVILLVSITLQFIFLKMEQEFQEEVIGMMVVTKMLTYVTQVL